MGNCTSCSSGTITAAAAAAAATVKLILLDGQLREFPSPVKVFLVAQPATDLCSFVCNADEMDFDKHVTAMSDDEELRLGHLYFQLPSSWLNRRLEAEDMASLAVKAGTALMVASTTTGSGKVRCGCCVKQVDPLVFCFDDELMSSSRCSDGGGGDIGDQNHGGRGRSGGGKERMFTSLERIAEE